MKELRELQNEIEEIEQQFRREIFDDSQLPPILYHYTNVYGLQGIVESSKWYATHYLYMNDGKEIIYGDELVQEELDKRIDTEPDDWVKKTYNKCLGKEYGSPSLLREFDYDIYIVSFSEEGNLLDQWRAYGDDGEGYSIGINPSKLAAIITGPIITDPKNLAFVKVEYNPSKQNSLIRNAIDEARLILKRELAGAVDDTHRNQLCTLIASHLSRTLIQLSLFFKHPAFQNEKEWRVVRIRWGRHPMTGINPGSVRNVDFRSGKGILIPYMKLNFHSMATDEVDENERLLPLKHILIGPKHKYREQQAQHSLEMQLLKKGYEPDRNNPLIRMSQIPYQ
ncbi:MAG: hypothetical protein CL610_14500 [Anaerolineaceae bacterium]|nr:hypothetical protein [Anaerolineaceae bacterium]